jgi:hypothetical protein
MRYRNLSALPNWDLRLSIARNVLFWTTNEAIQIFSWADNNWLFADWENWCEEEFLEFFAMVKEEYLKQQPNRGER